MENNIFVIGGTGKTGRRVAEKLTKLNQNVELAVETIIHHSIGIILSLILKH